MMRMCLTFFGGGRGGGGFRGGRQRSNRRPHGDTPGDNRAQNRQFRGAVNQLRSEGLRLNEREVRRLHNAISRQGLGFWEIVEMGRAMFG